MKLLQLLLGYAPSKSSYPMFFFSWHATLWRFSIGNNRFNLKHFWVIWLQCPNRTFFQKFVVGTVDSYRTGFSVAFFLPTEQKIKNNNPNNLT